MHTTRRRFIQGCCSAIAAMSGSRITGTMFDQGSPLVNQADGSTSTGEILVVLYLRGGMDGLNFIPPVAGDSRGFYESFRPTLKIPTTGENAALPLNGEFGMHPRATALHEIFQNGNLAIVNAVGNAGSRSHFDAQTYMELGTPFVKTTKSGWLTRTLGTQPDLPPDVLLPVLAAGSSAPTSLFGEQSTLNMSNGSSIGFSNAHWDMRDDIRKAVRDLYSDGFSLVKDAGLQALNAADIIETFGSESYNPANGAEYPNNGLGRDLRTIASMIKLDLGLRVATVDYGGWDTHDTQDYAPNNGNFSNKIGTISDSLAAFYKDLDGSEANSLSKRTTVLVMSEFGRRVRENADRGTDHGSGNVFLVMGGSVKGGVHGTFPGLQNDQLFMQTDLKPTTDYRTILSEVIIRRMANPNIGNIFPGFDEYQPLDLVEGIDLTPQYGPGQPEAPVVSELLTLGDNTIQVTWNEVDFAKGYRVEMRTDEAGDWEIVQIYGDESQTTYLASDLVAGGYYEFRVHAFNDAGNSERSNASAAFNRSALENWRFTHYGRIDNAGDAADDLDINDNGVTNLLAFALNLDPLDNHVRKTDGLTPGMPDSRMEDGIAKYRFLKPGGRDNIDYKVEISTNLVNWITVPLSTVATTGIYEEMEASAPQNFNPCFFRLIVDRIDT
ncbi:MAG: DUF1501 domain-containing protein [Verrucomicrobia bacterium]|nr:DUF1501 domain-containing protein [Verrucomicrobiota bacterium]